MKCLLENFAIIRLTFIWGANNMKSLIKWLVCFNICWFLFKFFRVIHIVVANRIQRIYFDVVRRKTVILGTVARILLGFLWIFLSWQPFIFIIFLYLVAENCITCGSPCNENELFLLIEISRFTLIWWKTSYFKNFRFFLKRKQNSGI